MRITGLLLVAAMLTGASSPAPLVIQPTERQIPQCPGNPPPSVCATRGCFCWRSIVPGPDGRPCLRVISRCLESSRSSTTDQ